MQVEKRRSIRISEKTKSLITDPLVFRIFSKTVLDKNLQGDHLNLILNLLSHVGSSKTKQICPEDFDKVQDTTGLLIRLCSVQ